MRYVFIVQQKQAYGWAIICVCQTFEKANELYKLNAIRECKELLPAPLSPRQLWRDGMTLEESNWCIVRHPLY